MNKEFITKVAKVQQELKAPKNQYNAFGKYKYRSCEDILEGLKHVLGELVVTVTDDVQMVGDRIYIKATATITDGESSLSNSAFARESLTKKGMDDSQITGTASSYARKYALNGLFLIDDTKDADSMDNSVKQPTQADLIKAIKASGWTVEQVLNSFTPPLTNLKDIQDIESCIAFLKANEVR